MASSISISSPPRSGAVKLISSSRRSITVCRRRAPMFSTDWLISADSSASVSSAPSVKLRVTPSVPISAVYWRISEFSGSRRMRPKSSRVSAFSSTRIGRRPCSSGSRSAGFARWNAPEAMNRMWSVFTAPCLVTTVVPSINGSRSRCTPSRLTSAPCRSERAVILSISSRKTMPSFSTAFSASYTTFSSSSSLSASSEIRTS